MHANFWSIFTVLAVLAQSISFSVVIFLAHKSERKRQYNS